MCIELRWVLHSQDHEFPPGRLVDAKRGDTSEPGYPQPQADEATERFIDWAIRVHHAARG
jgi:hypothetical protein